MRTSVVILGFAIISRKVVVQRGDPRENVPERVLPSPGTVDWINRSATSLFLLSVTSTRRAENGSSNVFHGPMLRFGVVDRVQEPKRVAAAG
jgi:hypothetical protein